MAREVGDDVNNSQAQVAHNPYSDSLMQAAWGIDGSAPEYEYPGIETFGGRYDTVNTPDGSPHHRSGAGARDATTVRAWKGHSVGPLSADQHQRYLQMANAARATYPDNPVMQRLVVAQALLESGSQLDSPQAQHNNFFGIKGSGTAGSGTYRTKEYLSGSWTTVNAAFAHNATPEDSFLQHKAFLEKPGYRGVLAAAKNGDFLATVTELKAAGYATDPNYPSKLAAIDNRMQSVWAEVKDTPIA
jgi:flagellum-specific peptidoglycan hydrolase FlgJ